MVVTQYTSSLRSKKDKIWSSVSSHHEAMSSFTTGYFCLSVQILDESQGLLYLVMAFVASILLLRVVDQT